MYRLLSFILTCHAFIKILSSCSHPKSNVYPSLFPVKPQRIRGLYYWANCFILYSAIWLYDKPVAEVIYWSQHNHYKEPLPIPISQISNTLQVCSFSSFPPEEVSAQMPRLCNNCEEFVIPKCYNGYIKVLPIHPAVLRYLLAVLFISLVHVQWFMTSLKNGIWKLLSIHIQ